MEVRYRARDADLRIHRSLVVLPLGVESGEVTDRAQCVSSANQFACSRILIDLTHLSVHLQTYDSHGRVHYDVRQVRFAYPLIDRNIAT